MQRDISDQISLTLSGRATRMPKLITLAKFDIMLIDSVDT